MKEQPSDATTSDVQEPEELKVCLSCATPNHPLADFCVQCGAPIGKYTNYDPLKHIYSEGWGYRKAVSSRHIKPIVLVGMWLIFGPMVIFIGIAVPDMLFDYWSPVHSSTSGVLGFMITAGIWLLYVAILWRVTKNYWKRRRFVPGTCYECGYNLTSVTEYRCPECGAPFDPEDHVVELALPAPPGATEDEDAADETAIPLTGLRYLLGVAAAIIGSVLWPSFLPVQQQEIWVVMVVYLVAIVIPLEIYGVRKLTTSRMQIGLLHIAGLLLNTLHGVLLVVGLLAQQS